MPTTTTRFGGDEMPDCRVAVAIVHVRIWKYSRHTQTPLGPDASVAPLALLLDRHVSLSFARALNEGDWK